MARQRRTPQKTVAPRSRYVLTIFQSSDPDDPLAALDRGLFYEALEKIRSQVSTPPESSEIDIWIDSSGGDAHAAYKLMLALRGFASTVRAVIPDYAKSAATLLAIGCDEIYMSPYAELGPLDVQIEHPDREGTTISGLDVAKSLQFLHSFAVESMVQGGYRLLKSTGLSRRDIITEVSKFEAHFLQPVISKLDPQLIHRAAQDLEVAKEYATRVLRSRGIPTPPTPSERFDTWEEWLASRLVGGYPSHGFVISLNEAKAMQLPVRAGTAYALWDQSQTIWQIAQQGGKTVLEFWSESVLQGMAQHVQSSGNNADEKKNATHKESGNDNAKRTAKPASQSAAPITSD